MPNDAALRQAKLTFGSAEAAREDAREAQRARLMENVASDVRFALRTLRRAPSFAVATILTMTLGIGASTAIFSVVDSVLLRPLPIPQPADFTYLGWQWKSGDDIAALSAFQYEFVRQHNRTFAAVAEFSRQEVQLGAGNVASPVRGLRVNGDFFRTIGFVPKLGRAFDSTELALGDAPILILGDATWRIRFGADPKIIGRRILVDGDPRTVVGVMPPNFQFPPSPEDIGYLVPEAVKADPADEGRNTEAIARVRHGIAGAARDADLAALTRSFRATYPNLASPREGFKLFSNRDVQVGDTQRTLLVLFAAVSLLLLIACANTAALLLVRASARQREIAVRASIGAGPARILQQLLTEGAVLAAVSAVLGVALGMLAVRGFLAVAPSVLPAGMAPSLDGRVLAYAVAISVITGLVFGLAAAIPSFRVRLQSGILSGARGATSGGALTRETLVFVETASAVVLLAGATLLTASFARLTHVDPGFDVDKVTAIKLGRLPAGYDSARTAQLIDGLFERIRTVPGVEQAALAPNLPLERGMNLPVDTREHPELGTGAVELRFVSPGYLATLGVPLLAGRDFATSDDGGSEPVAIVNEAFVKHFWKGDPPMGRTIRIGHFRNRWLRGISPTHQVETAVVGVSRDMHELGLNRPAKPTVLVPQAQLASGTPVLLVRGDPSRIASTLRMQVVAAEPQLTPQIEPLSAVLSRSVAAPRFRTLLIGSFALSALLLAAVGIYGVIAAVVQQRTREIGIRLSLGAPRASVALAVIRRCLVSVSAGSVIGLLAFWMLRRSLTTMLYDT
ncbi:MAG TPA: ABC transporter permease, partial [Gemmatimonadaceae bacterium]|nr:ABC transporter permease [Gemmatimonadaceae bacterium]